ncbi:multivesicular body subunit 12A isoform X2 [Amia ocellicauda]|uniref:multivesicular body subunit 12A isoform X2 n=1 Tax=Amia ocellicauda TaxID=2972642 RepID=UPI003464C03A
MSFYMSGTPPQPVTALAWTSNINTCPRDFTLINVTQDGSTAHFVKGFGLKSGYYLCYSTSMAGGMVVADIQIISEKESIPHGYCYIPEYLENKVSVSKKKRVCVRMVPLTSADRAVLDIKLTGKSRVVLPHYTCLGDMHGFVVWCKKSPFSHPAPQAKPRNLSLDMKGLSLEQQPPPLPLRPSTPRGPALGKLSRRRSNLEFSEMEETSNIYNISAMDGVPFALHPRFEAKAEGGVPSMSLNNIQIKSVQDIENEYNYTFTVEKTAASRTCPVISHSSSLTSNSQA